MVMMWRRRARGCSSSVCRRRRRCCRDSATSAMCWWWILPGKGWTQGCCSCCRASMRRRSWPKVSLHCLWFYVSTILAVVRYSLLQLRLHTWWHTKNCFFFLIFSSYFAQIPRYFTYNCFNFGCSEMTVSWLIFHLTRLIIWIFLEILGLRRLIYISCGFDALERDSRYRWIAVSFAYLIACLSVCRALVSSGRWRVTSSNGFVLFPGSDHVESVVVFDRSWSIERKFYSKLIQILLKPIWFNFNIPVNLFSNFIFRRLFVE